MLQAKNLKCVGGWDSSGVIAKNTRFSWMLESDKQNVSQTEYRLQMSESPNFETAVWDTGDVKSGESINVRFENGLNADMQKGVRYYCRVKAKDNYGEESPWSEGAFFELALPLGKNGEKFISNPEDREDESKGYYFRKEFDASRKPVSVRITATALGLYYLYINGSPVSDYLFAPGWTEYKKRLAYQTYDVTQLVKTGKNAVGALVGVGWYKGDMAWENRRNFYGKRAAFVACVYITYDNGEKEVIVTDETWKTFDTPVRYSEFYNGETYDARKELPGWNEADFDDKAWSGVALTESYHGVLYPQDSPPVKRHENFKPIEVITTPKGEKVLDFGQNMAGWVRVTGRGASGDEIIIKHAEILDANGNFYTENLRGAKCTNRYILKGGEAETFEPHFTFQGFRYAMLEKYPGEIKPENFTAVAVYSDLQQAGSFSCSNPMLNQLEKNIRWGLKSNFVEVPTDCPQRNERLGWTGDAQVFIKAACYLTDTYDFYKKWLGDLAEGQLESGSVPVVIPDSLGAYAATGWGDAATICPWQVYLSYGNKEILENQYESMKKWVEYIRSQALEGLIWNTGSHYGDWLALDAKEGSYVGSTSKDLLATAYYAYSAEIVAKTAKILNRPDDEKKYASLHKDIADAYEKEFFTPRGRLAARTQTAHIISLMFGLTPERFKARTIDCLLELLKENDNHLVTGFLGTPYFCHVLSDNGHLDKAYNLLLREEYPSWLYQVKAGGTTVWEHWDGIKPDGTMWSANMNSFNHYAYGAVGDWMYQNIGGLAIDEEHPGYKHFIVKPRPGGGIDQASLSYQSPYGTIDIEWHLDNGVMSLAVGVPPNTSATVILPDGQKSEVGSGHYTFQCENVQ